MLLYRTKRKGDIMGKSYFSLLTKEQVYGRNILEVINKEGVVTNQSDLLTILGANGSYFLNSKRNDTFVHTISQDKYNDAIFFGNKGGVRPVISFSMISNQTRNRRINANGILEVEYGFYPQNVIVYNDDEEVYLNNQFHTSNHYIIGSNNGFTEYIYNDTRYIMAYNYGISLNLKKLTSGYLPEKGKYYCIKVEPIKWLVDTKTNLAISKNIISYSSPSEINYCLHQLYHDIHQINQEDYYVLNKKYYSLSTNKKTNEVSVILDEINKYQKYYYGKIDIAEKVNKLITEYNHKVNNVLTSNKNILTLENTDKDSLYSKLLADLNQILASLKLNYENNKVYHDILELLDNCLLVLDKQKNTPKTELEKDLKTITDIIIPYLNDDNNLNGLKEIFLKEKKYITTTIENMANLSSKINGKYKNISEFELTIRKELQLFLMNIYKDIIEKDIANEIINSYKMIASNNYEESKCSVIKVYLDTLNELAEYIKVNGTKEDIQELNNVLNDINISNNLNSTIKDLINIIKKLYLIQFSITDRINNAKLVKEYTINISKVNK